MARTRMVLSSALATSVLVLLSERVSSAQEAMRFELVTTGDSRTCGDGDILRARISERIGRDPFTAAADAPDVARVRVSFARDKNTWTAEVAHHDRTGKRTGVRTLTHAGPTCAPLVASVVFTIAVVLEELAPVTAPDPAPAPTAPPPPTPQEVPPAEDKPPPPPAPPRSLHFDVSIAGTGALGAAPAPNAGGEGALGIDLGRLRIDLGARAFLPASSDGDPAVRTRLVYGRIAPCYGWPVLAGCLVVALGSLSGEGTGASVATSRVDGGFYGSGGVGLLSRIFFVKDVLFARASLDVLASFTRSSFDIGGERVWSLPVVGAAMALGIGARLP